MGILHKSGYINDPWHKRICTKSSKSLMIKEIHVKILSNLKSYNVKCWECQATGTLIQPLWKAC